MAFLVAALSPGQVTFFVAYAWSMVLWLLSEFLHYTSRKPTTYEQLPDTEPHGKADHKIKMEDSNGTASGDKAHSTEHGAAGADSEPPSGKRYTCSAKAGTSFLSDVAGSGGVRCLMFDLNAIYAHRATLKSMCEFGTIMLWYFLCDRTTIFPESAKSYNRDLFMFLFIILTCVAFGSSLSQFKIPLLLNRPQTEEWKGWMQVLFLMYHYFDAKEVYNAIRIFIAAYVWMTGFGNFSYYWKTNDFSAGRFAQMLWRLNFLVFFACLVMKNSYMLYYICPMHTIFTVMVYVALGICPHVNTNHFWVAVKIVLCLGSVLILWDIKPVFYALWSPFAWLVGYVDPRKPSDDVLYEWHFRSGLDRFIWIYGMLCAHIHPYVAAMFTWIDNSPAIRKYSMRALITAICGVVGYYWYINVYVLPKPEYNKVHPYTSWIPITIWMLLRNMTPDLRLYHLRLYGWLGCITLETYICQFHIWMKTSIPDGQPKALLSIIPNYPYCNYALVTAIYIYISYRIFQCTNALKNAAVPHDNNKLLVRNSIIMAAGGLLLYVTVYGLLAMFVYRSS